MKNMFCILKDCNYEEAESRRGSAFEVHLKFLMNLECGLIFLVLLSLTFCGFNFIAPSTSHHDCIKLLTCPHLQNSLELSFTCSYLPLHLCFHINYIMYFTEESFFHLHCVV